MCGSVLMPLNKRSEALPFINGPSQPWFYEMVGGEAGFDPLGLARTPALLEYFRAAEIKHGRLALLASVGWPASELWDRPLSSLTKEITGLSIEPKVTALGDAPSLLNGGLDQVDPRFWGFAIGVAAAAELYALKLRFEEPGLAPGDLRFDPLGFYPTEKNRRRRMDLAELKHSRLAMVAVVGYAAEEYLLGTPVAQHSSGFFEPFWHHFFGL
eukprot:CAMPEP_0119272614 /NCGR_PEP_ID=MMETSP1329-20130426/8812_1 /TAXON_ID=114041 /ORGANISM="Genus nov. species nov., Strain RCC1024" /LENGTH=212 /DNA_ID=CAMNT_0007272691 /DNA_START=154 /DNA_END=792 /DNA_ORIENTATION=+